jgi:Immunity protein 49
MKTFPRHHLNNIPFIEKRLDRFKTRVDDSLPKVLKRPAELLGSKSKEVFDLVSVAVVAARPRSEILHYMHLALALGFANFQSAMAPGETLLLPYKDQLLPFEGAVTTAYTDPIYWSKLFYLSVILRNHTTTKALMAIPELLMQQSNVQADGVDFAMMRFLKGIYDSNANIAELILNAMRLTDPNLNDEARVDYLLELKVPELALYRCIFSSKAEEFNEELYSALVNHQHYWVNGELDYASEGWLAYPLIAASVIAYGAKKFSIEVDSDYVPLWLVKAEFE